MHISPAAPLTVLRQRVAEAGQPPAKVVVRSSEDLFEPVPLEQARQTFAAVHEEARRLKGQPRSSAVVADVAERFLQAGADVLRAQSVPFELVSVEVEGGREERIELQPSKGGPLGLLAQALDREDSRISFSPTLLIEQGVEGLWLPYERTLHLDVASIRDARVHLPAGHETLHFRHFVRREAGILAPYQIRSVAVAGEIPGGLGPLAYGRMLCADEIPAFAFNVRTHLQELIECLRRGERLPEQSAHAFQSDLFYGLDVAMRQLALSDAFRRGMADGSLQPRFIHSYEGFPAYEFRLLFPQTRSVVHCEVGLTGSTGSEDPENGRLCLEQLQKTETAAQREGGGLNLVRQLWMKTMAAGDDELTSLVPEWESLQRALRAKSSEALQPLQSPPENA